MVPGSSTSVVLMRVASLATPRPQWETSVPSVIDARHAQQTLQPMQSQPAPAPARNILPITTLSFWTLN